MSFIDTVGYVCAALALGVTTIALTGFIGLVLIGTVFKLIRSLE